MAFFEELGKTLSDTGKEVATKAKVLSDTIQLKTQISTEKTKLKEAYAVVGKQFYESNKEPDEMYDKAYEAVRASRERIAALEIELTQSEGSHICAECGAKVPKNSFFCGKCGAPVKEAEDESDKEDEEAVTRITELESDPAGINAAHEDAFESTEDQNE
ncbi:zinc ribbon domain-containing protein [Clostridium sp. E02]|uniref:zinc ribbon domain-containing protein n=1 Tax=Clostridium sp. E02 TaxID=2487134 RepID=UPI000F5280EB|nr:zinc ribbon domain-containing protein [Clostridium sp. E02]